MVPAKGLAPPCAGALPGRIRVEPRAAVLPRSERLLIRQQLINLRTPQVPVRDLILFRRAARIRVVQLQNYLPGVVDDPNADARRELLERPSDEDAPISGELRVGVTTLDDTNADATTSGENAEINDAG